MLDTVAVPLWLAVAGALLALWAFYEHALMPMRRRLPTSSITWFAGCITIQRNAGISTCS